MLTCEHVLWPCLFSEYILSVKLGLIYKMAQVLSVCQCYWLIISNYYCFGSGSWISILCSDLFPKFKDGIKLPNRFPCLVVPKENHYLFLNLPISIGL
jgi:hypothetical protein